MDVTIVELTSIRPYERNPRLNDSAIDAVAKSLQEFGFRQSKSVRPRVTRRFGPCRSTPGR